MRIAFALISDFKSGAIPPGTPITHEHDRLLRLLADDLQVKQSGASIEQLVPRSARADSFWNKRTMATIDRLYRLQEAGEQVTAEHERTAFLGECPSVWYCGIVSSL